MMSNIFRAPDPSSSWASRSLYHAFSKCFQSNLCAKGSTPSVEVLVLEWHVGRGKVVGPGWYLMVFVLGGLPFAVSRSNRSALVSPPPPKYIGLTLASCDWIATMLRSSAIGKGAADTERHRTKRARSIVPRYSCLFIVVVTLRCFCFARLCLKCNCRQLCKEILAGEEFQQILPQGQRWTEELQQYLEELVSSRKGLRAGLNLPTEVCGYRTSVTTLLG